MNIPLPLSKWEIISNKVDENEPLNPMERFIYENLPAGEDGQLFYIQLRDAIEYVVESAIKSPNSKRAPCTCKKYGNFRKCPVCGGDIFYQTV